MQRVFILAFVLVLAFAHTASGRSGPPKRTVSVSIFSLHHPVVEISGEFRIKKNMGLTGIVGAGSMDGSTVLEIGGQYKFFASGNFNNGIQLGLETVYTSISPLYGTALIKNGLSTGLFFGFKGTDDYMGITMDFQLGFAGVMNTNHANNSSSFAFTEGRIIFRTNIGWSF